MKTNQTGSSEAPDALDQRPNEPSFFEGFGGPKTVDRIQTLKALLQTEKPDSTINHGPNTPPVSNAIAPEFPLNKVVSDAPNASEHSETAQKENRNENQKEKIDLRTILSKLFKNPKTAEQTLHAKLKVMTLTEVVETLLNTPAAFGRVKSNFPDPSSASSAATFTALHAALENAVKPPIQGATPEPPLGTAPAVADSRPTTPRGQHSRAKLSVNATGTRLTRLTILERTALKP